MAIRDRFRRALHKSPSEDSISQSGSGSNTTTSTTTSSSKASSLHRQPTNSKFALPWHRSEKEKEQRKEEKEKKKQSQPRKKTNGKTVHPRDRPLTAANLRHQEMLGGFDFSFGSSPDRLSQVLTTEDWDYIGVSPCCTRVGSINGDYASTPNTLDDSDSDQDPGASEAASPNFAASVPE